MSPRNQPAPATSPPGPPGQDRATPDRAVPDRAAPGGSRALLLVLSATMLIDALEVSIVIVALPSISAGLGLPVATAQWVMSGFALGFGVTAPKGPSIEH